MPVARCILGLLILLAAPACAYGLRFNDIPNTVRYYDGTATTTVKGQTEPLVSEGTLAEAVVKRDGGVATLAPVPEYPAPWAVFGEAGELQRDAAGTKGTPIGDHTRYVLSPVGFTLIGLPATCKDGDTWTVRGLCPAQSPLTQGDGTFTATYTVFGLRDINGGQGVLIECRLTAEEGKTEAGFTQTRQSLSQVIFDEAAGLVLAVNDTTRLETHATGDGGTFDTITLTKARYWLTLVRTLDPARPVPPVPGVTPEPDFTANPPITRSMYRYLDTTRTTIADANEQLRSTGQQMPTRRVQAAYQIRPDTRAYVWFDDGKTLYADTVYLPAGPVTLPRGLARADVDKRLGKAVDELPLVAILWGGNDGSRVKGELLGNRLITKAYVPAPKKEALRNPAP
jgi:hypothetical protein